jgi:S1-C subfamily serine protease
MLLARCDRLATWATARVQSLTYHARMPEPDEKTFRVSRESRLLLLTVVVCVVVLLLLARVRFPEPAIVETVAQPLERLAARASYDALAADIERVEAMIAPNLVVLRTALRFDVMPRRTRDVLAPPELAADARHVAALRISPDTALAAIAPGVRIDGIVGETGSAAVLATDPVRRLSRVRVPEGPSRPIVALPLGSLRTPVYVVAVEGTQAGVTVRPVFLGRSTRFESARWSQPLLPLGGTALATGALLFSMAGEFIGCVVTEDGASAIVGARDALETVERLASASPPVPATLGIAVQPLTPALALATGAGHGVVVAEVDPDGPSSGLLLPGDVVVTVRGNVLDRPDRFLLHVAAAPPDEPMALTVVRAGEPLDVTVVPAAAGTGAETGGEAIAFEQAPGSGTRVTAAGAGEGSLVTGLIPGDIVLSAGTFADPTPGQLRELLADLPPQKLLVVTVRRGTEQRVLAVGVSPRADVTTD